MKQNYSLLSCHSFRLKSQAGELMPIVQCSCGAKMDIPTFITNLSSQLNNHPRAEQHRETNYCRQHWYPTKSRCFNCDQNCCWRCELLIHTDHLLILKQSPPIPPNDMIGAFDNKRRIISKASYLIKLHNKAFMIPYNNDFEVLIKEMKVLYTQLFEAFSSTDKIQILKLIGNEFVEYVNNKYHQELKELQKNFSFMPADFHERNSLVLGHKNHVTRIKLISKPREASSSSDKEIKVWSLTTFECMAFFLQRDVTDFIELMSINEFHIQKWSIDANESLNTLLHNTKSNSLIELPDGRIVTWYFNIYFWDFNNQTLLAAIKTDSLHI